jgi:hypothetical protein
MCNVSYFCCNAEKHQLIDVLAFVLICRFGDEYDLPEEAHLKMRILSSKMSTLLLSVNDWNFDIVELCKRAHGIILQLFLEITN